MQNVGNHAQQLVGLMAPQRASTIVDPPQVVDTIKLTKRIQVTIPTPTTGSIVISPALLAAGVPGGSTYWRDMRIERLDFWSTHAPATGSGSDTIVVTAAGNSGNGQTVAQWLDSGVPGKRRAHVGFRLGLLERARFWNTADNTPLSAVSYDGGASSMLCQAVVELNSNFIV